MDVVEAEVLATISQDVLRPSVIERAIRLVIDELSPARQVKARTKLEAERQAVHAACERLVEAIGRGGPMDVLLARLTERRARRDAIDA